MDNRIGIFGGTFDPVHIGHLCMAQCAMEQAELDRVIFVPNGMPPHKDSRAHASAQHRFNMLAAATADNPFFEVSDFELSVQEPHYTVDTMRFFKKKYPDSELVFVVGADSLSYIDKWRDGGALIRENVFAAVNRSFDSGYSFEKNMEAVRAMGGSVIPVEMPQIGVSSTYIRRAVSMGASVRYFTGEPVSRYIDENKLYGSSQ